MKSIRIAVIVLACLLTVNVGMAITPDTLKIEKEKNIAFKKIKRAASTTSFVDFVRDGESELIVLRCTINENNEVKVSKVIGFNEELMQAVRNNMNKKKIKVNAALSGQELALRLNFAKYEK
nr:hypothetical protein [uncultured Marinifilum sp.]